MNAQVKRPIHYKPFIAMALFVIATLATYATLIIPSAYATVPYFVARESQAVPVTDQFGYISALGVDAQDNVIVGAGTFLGEIFIYSPTGQSKEHFILQACEAYGENVYTSVQAVAVAGDGTIYVANSGGSVEGVLAGCIQRYSSDGEYIGQFGTIGQGDGVEFGKIALDSTSLYVVDNATKTIRILDLQTGQQRTQVGGEGAGQGQFGGRIDALASYNDQFYVGDYGNSRIQVFSNQGVYVREINSSDFSSGPGLRAITITPSGMLFVAVGGLLYIVSNDGTQFQRYDVPVPEGAQQGVGINVIASDSTGRAYTAQSGASDTRSLYAYDLIALDAPNYAPVDIQVTNLQDTSATLSWTYDSREPEGHAITGYQFRVAVKSNGAVITSGSGSGFAGRMQVDVTNLRPGIEYVVYASSVNADGVGPEASHTFKTTGTPPPPIVLDPTKRTLMLTGENFLGDDTLYTAFERSLVTFNGEALKACSEGTGMTRQQLIDALSLAFPNLGANVTDSTPCYMLIENQIETVLTDTQVIILLPENYNFNARGTVRINGGNEIVFNDTSGNDGATIQVNGVNPSSGTLQLPKRLSFSGKATPGATVTVTVHSDPVVCTAIADTNGNWSCTLPSDLPAGNHTVYVAVTNPDDSIENLGPYSITVVGEGGGGTITDDTPKAPNTGFIAQAKHYYEQKVERQRDGVVMSTGVGFIVSALGASILFGIAYIKRRRLL